MRRALCPTELPWHCLWGGYWESNPDLAGHNRACRARGHLYTIVAIVFYCALEQQCALEFPGGLRWDRTTNHGIFNPALYLD